VSFDADPATGVQVYDSYNGASGAGDNWFVIGGTSLSAPCWAGLIAITNQIRDQFFHLPALTGGTQTLPRLYELAVLPSVYASAFHDVTSGGNGTFNAGTGYDLVTGLGTPDATNLLPYLAEPTYTVSSPRDVSTDAGLTAVFEAGGPPTATVQWQVST